MTDLQVGMEKFLQIVQDAVRQEKKDDALVIDSKTSFATYGFDSLDMMNILIAVEESLGISLEDFEITENDSCESFYEKVSQVLE